MKNLTFLLRKIFLTGGVVVALAGLQPATLRALPDIDCVWYTSICCTVCYVEGEMVSFDCENILQCRM